MDEMDEFIDELESKVRSIRQSIRKFYLDFPQYSPEFRGKSKEEIMHTQKVRDMQRRMMEPKQMSDAEKIRRAIARHSE